MTATCLFASVCPRASVEKAAEPVGALPITTIVAVSLEAVERVRPGWNRWRSGYSLATPKADPDRYLATLRGLGGHARPYVTMLHGGAEPHPLIVGREQVRFGRIRFEYLQIPAPLLRSLDTVYRELITDHSRQAVRVILDHLRHLIDAGRFEKPARIEELAAGAAQITVCTYQAALGAGAVNTTVHRFAAGLDRRVSDVAVGCGVLTRVKKRWRGRLAERRKSPTAGRGWE